MLRVGLILNPNVVNGADINELPDNKFKLTRYLIKLDKVISNHYC